MPPPRIVEGREEGTGESSSPPRASGPHDELRRNIYERLVEAGYLQASLRDKLYTHFDKLPRRYLIDLGVERAEDVLLHWKILDKSAKQENSYVFHARLLEVYLSTLINSALQFGRSMKAPIPIVIHAKSCLMTSLWRGERVLITRGLCLHPHGIKNRPLFMRSSSAGSRISGSPMPPPRIVEGREEGTGESSSPPRASGPHDELRRNIYERLVEAGYLQASLRDKLYTHFDKLPRRYLIDLGVERAEDVLLHWKILDKSAKQENSYVFHARLLECLTVRPEYEGTNSDCDPCQKLLDDLTLERRKGADNTGSMSASSRDQEQTFIHEIIFSSLDKPKLLSWLTSLLSQVGLNIREAHVYSTTDGFCLDVFVVEGWNTEETDELLTKINNKLLQRNALPPNSPNCSTSEKIHELRQQVGDCEIDWSMLTKGEMIASGSSADLHRGTYDGFDVAIKLLRDAHLNNPSENEFLQEILILRSVNHENILQFYGACTRPPNCCIVTEYMPEGNLYDFLHKQNNVLDLLLILRIAISISKGMEYLHQNNIIHRDLKTANVLIGYDQQVVKIADFGVARLGSQEGQMTAETGTYRWMVPEIINHKSYDHKADVFSFAVVVWELITLKVPYDNMTPLQAALGVWQGVRLDIPPSAHPRLSKLIQQCWEEDPDARPIFAEVIVELEDILQHIQGRHRRSRAKVQKKSSQG